MNPAVLFTIPFLVFESTFCIFQSPPVLDDAFFDGLFFVAGAALSLLVVSLLGAPLLSSALAVFSSVLLVFSSVAEVFVSFVSDFVSDFFAA